VKNNLKSTESQEGGMIRSHIEDDFTGENQSFAIQKIIPDELTINKKIIKKELNTLQQTLR